MQRTLSIVLFFAVFYVSVLTLLYFFQRSLLYHPSSADVVPSSYGLNTVKLVRVTTEDGLHLAAWYGAAKGELPTLVYFHGNAGHIGHRSEKIRPYLRVGFGILLLSYRGYGPNAGFPTEPRLYMDGRAALKYLADRGVPILKTVLYGESLGTGVVMELAQGVPFGAVVLEAPFSSVLDVAQHKFPFAPARFMVKDKFDSVAKAKRLRSPILVAHGVHDRIIPIRFGLRLFEVLPEPKVFKSYPAAGHNDLYEHDMPGDVIEFIRRNVPGSAIKNIE